MEKEGVVGERIIFLKLLSLRDPTEWDSEIGILE
jgi:hypothetical protein